MDPHHSTPPSMLQQSSLHSLFSLLLHIILASFNESSLTKSQSLPHPPSVLGCQGRDDLLANIHRKTSSGFSKPTSGACAFFAVRMLRVFDFSCRDALHCESEFSYGVVVLLVLAATRTSEKYPFELSICWTVFRCILLHVHMVRVLMRLFSSCAFAIFQVLAGSEGLGVCLGMGRARW